MVKSYRPAGAIALMVVVLGLSYASEPPSLTEDQRGEFDAVQHEGNGAERRSG